MFEPRPQWHQSEPRGPGWSELEVLAVEGVDQLEKVGDIDDPLWAG
jgi:hypothetical protein